MANTKKSVDISLNIKGVNTKSLDNIIKAFDGLEKSTKNAVSNIDKLKKSINSVKVPANFTKFTNNLEKLSTVKLSPSIANNLEKISKLKVPNLKNISDGFISLGKIKTPPNLKEFANELEKFKNIKLPNLINIAEGFKKLKDIEKPKNLSDFANELNKLGKVKLPSLTGLVNGLKKLTELNITAVSAKITRLNSAIKRLDKAGYLSSFSKFASDLNKVSSALSRTTEQQNKFEDSVRRSSNGVRTFTDRLKTYSQYLMASNIVRPLEQAFRQAIVVISEYDQSLKDLQAITGSTGLEVEQMGEKILEVASTTKFSASEIASGMKVIAQSGFTASESIQTMQAVSDLATGTLSEMASTVDLVTTAMRVFNIDASKSSDVADVFANAVNKSKLTIDKLRTAMNYIGPVSRSIGVSFGELSTAMGTLANEGIRASTIGTGLRNVFSQLANPSEKLEKAARKAGVALADLDPTTDGLGSVISNLSLIVQDTGTAFDIFGKRGSAAILALTANQDKYNSMFASISESGSAARQASIQMEGLAVSFKNLKDKLGVLVIAIGDSGLTAVFKGTVDVLRFAVEVFTDFAQTIGGKFVIGVGLATTAVALFNKTIAIMAGTRIGAMLTSAVASLGLFTTATGSATAGLYGLQVALGPVYWAIVGIVAVIGTASYFLLFADHARKASDEASKLADTLKVSSKKIQDYRLSVLSLKKGSDQLKKSNLDLRKELLKVSEGHGEQAKAARKVVQAIDPLNGVIREGSTAIEEYQNTLNKLTFESLKTALEESVASVEKQTDSLHIIAGSFTTHFEIISEVIRNSWKFLLAGMSGDWSEMWGSIINTFKGIVTKISGYIKFLKFGHVFDKNKKSWQDMQNEIDSWDPEKMTKAQEKAKEAFENTTLQAQKYADYLVKIKGLDLRGSSDYFEKMAKDSRLAGDELKATLHILQKMKKEQEDQAGFSNIVEKWIKEGDSKKLDTLGKEYNKLSNVIEKANIEKLEGYEKEKEAHKQKLNDLKEEATATISAKKDTEAWYKSYNERKFKILKDAEATQRKISNDSLAQQTLAYKRALQEKKEAEDKANVIFKNDKKGLYEELFRIRKEHEVKVSKITQGKENTKVELAKYKEGLAERQMALQTVHTEIDLLVAKSAITYEEGEQRKSEATLKHYADSYIEAQKYFNKVADQEGSKEYTKRKKILLNAERDYWKERSSLLSDYNEKYNKTIQDREKIEKKFAEKRIEISKETAEELLEVEQSIQDDINEVKRRGESKYQAQRKDRKEANAKLSKGEDLIDEGIDEGDEGKIAVGKKLLQQSAKLYKSLENRKKATRGLEKVEDALNKAILAKDKIKKQKLKEDEDDENDAVDKKLDDIEKTFKAYIEAEGERHKEVMKNIQAEIDSFKKGITEGSTVTIKAEVENNEEVNKLKENIEAVEGKEVEVKADVSGEKEVKSLGSKIKGLIGKAIEAIVNVKGIKDVLDLKRAIDDLKNKKVYIDVIKRGVDNTNVAAAHANTGGLIDNLIPKFAKGGQVFRRLSNRYINSGSGHKDDVPAMLMKGEYVLKQSAVEKLGIPFLEQLNNMKVDPSKLVPKFAKGGFVGNMNLAFPGFSNMKKKLEELMNPYGLANGVAMKVGDPTFTDHMTSRVNNISSPRGAGFAKRMMNTYSDSVQKLATGGSVDTTTTFSKEKQNLENEYNEEIRKAKNDGRSNYAQILENEKEELFDIAKDLETTLATLKQELEEELIAIKEEFKVTEQTLKDEYSQTMGNIDDNQKSTRITFNNTHASASKALKKMKDELEEMEKIAAKSDMKFPGGGAATVRIANLHFKNVQKAIKAIPDKKEEIANGEETLETLKEGWKTDKADFETQRGEAQKKYKQSYAEAEDLRTTNINEALFANSESVNEAKDDAKTSTINVMAEVTEEKAQVKNDTITSVAELKKEFREALKELEEKWKVSRRVANRGSNIPKFAKGGPIFQRKAQHIPGDGNVDDVPALLMKGEYVLRKDAVKKYGLNFLDKLNWGKLNLPKFAKGGPVLSSNVQDVLGKLKTSNLSMNNESLFNSQTQSIKKHQIDFTLGNKSFGPFQGDRMTMDSFITEMKIAQARA